MREFGGLATCDVGKMCSPDAPQLASLSCANTPLKSRVCKRDTGRGARQTRRRKTTLVGLGGVLRGLTHEKRPGEFEMGRNILQDVLPLRMNWHPWDGPKQEPANYSQIQTAVCFYK